MRYKMEKLPGSGGRKPSPAAHRPEVSVLANEDSPRQGKANMRRSESEMCPNANTGRSSAKGRCRNAPGPEGLLPTARRPAQKRRAAGEPKKEQAATCRSAQEPRGSGAKTIKACLSARQKDDRNKSAALAQTVNARQTLDKRSLQTAWGDYRKCPKMLNNKRGKRLS